jgi:hypothetical protein
MAHAQFAPMPLYEHPAKGAPDPYAGSEADHRCCGGQDCTPWPGEDIEPLPDGRYLIRSANHGKGAAVPVHKVIPSFNGQYHLCKPHYTGDVKFVDTTYNGEAMVYCLFVPQGF